MDKSKFFVRIGIMTAAGAVLLAAAPGLARAQEVTDAKVRDLLAQAQAAAAAAAPSLDAQAAPVAQPPQGSRPVINLSIEDAVAKAVDHNIDLSVARLGPQLQDLSLAQTRAAYTPTLASTQFGVQSRTSRSGNTLSGGTLIDTKTLTYDTGIQQILPWTGGTASLSWTNQRQESSSLISTINPRYDAVLTARLVQPLLRNRAIDNTRQQIAIGEINRRLADVTLRATTLTTLASTRNAYWDLVYAVQAVEAAKTSLQLAQKLVQDNQSRVEIGTMAPIDVVQAQSEAASRQLALVQAEANQRTAELTLKRLLVESTGDPLWEATLNPTDRPPAPPASETLDVAAAVKRALENRTDVVQAREQLKSNDISLKYLRNQKLPDVNLTANYGATGTGGTTITRADPITGAGAKATPGGYSDALSVLRQLQLPSWNVNVSISYPLGTSAQDVSYARAQVQLKQTQSQLRALELRIATEVTNAALNVQNALQRVQASAASKELSQRRLEAEQSKFEVGMSTNYNVVLAQRDYSDAQNAELRALLDYRKAVVEFERLQETGSGGSGVSSVGSGGQ